MTTTTSKPTTVDEYIEIAPQESQQKFREIRTCIQSVAPDAIEGLKWGMPAYSYKRILVTFAGFKHHIGFYPTPSAIETFKADLKDYKTASGSIQFPLDQPLPIALIKNITEYRVKQSKEEDEKWKQ